MPRSLLITLCLLFVQPLWAAGEKLPVWKVKTQQTEVVLLGSVHFAFADIYPLRPEIETAFSESDKLAVELDVTGPKSLEIQTLFLQQGMLPVGQTLPEQLSESNWTSLERYLRSRGLPLEGFMTFRPGLVVMMLTTMRLMEMGMSPELGIDQHFLGQARGEKPIVELETAQQQADLLLSFPDADLLIEQTLVEMDEIDLYMRPIYRAWKDGDEVALSRLMLEDELTRRPQFRALQEAMFDNRNYAMTEKIESFLKGQDRYFVVVGAGHLVGQKGIISLLKQRGYDVQPL